MVILPLLFSSTSLLNHPSRHSFLDMSVAWEAIQEMRNLQVEISNRRKSYLPSLMRILMDNHIYQQIPQLYFVPTRLDKGL